MATSLLLALALAGCPADDTPSYMGRTLTEWVADLNGADEAKQREALVAIQKLGPNAKAAVPDLRKILTNKQHRFRSEAAWALAAIGPDAREAVPEIRAAIKEEKGQTYMVASLGNALATLGEPDLESTEILLMATQPRCGGIVLLNTEYTRLHPGIVLGHLLDLCDHKDLAVRLRAISCIPQLKQEGPAAKRVPEVLEKLLADSNREVRVAAANTVSQIAPQLRQKTIPVIVEALENDNLNKASPEYSYAAILMPVAADAFPALLPLTDRPRNNNTRWHAVQVIAGLPVLPQVEKELKDNPKPQVRAAMADVLHSWYGSERPTAAPVIAALNDPVFEVRFAAADALFRVDEKQAATGLPVLCEALRNDDDAIRQHAGGLVAKLGPRARTAIPLLNEMLGDKSLAVRVEVATAMVAIDPKEAVPAVPALAEGLGSGWSAVRCAQALAEIGPPAKAAIPELVKHYTDSNPLIRLYAAEAAARIDPTEAPKAVEVVVELLRQNNTPGRRNRVEGALVLRRIGPAAKAAVPALCEMLQEKNEPFPEVLAVTAVSLDPDAAKPALVWIRKELADENSNDIYELAEELVTIGPNGKVLLPELVRLLKSKHSHYREQAALALGSIGPDAAVALPALREAAAGEKSPRLREAIAKAIQKIEAKPR